MGQQAKLTPVAGGERIPEARVDVAKAVREARQAAPPAGGVGPGLSFRGLPVPPRAS